MTKLIEIIIGILVAVAIFYGCNKLAIYLHERSSLPEVKLSQPSVTPGDCYASLSADPEELESWEKPQLIAVYKVLEVGKKKALTEVFYFSNVSSKESTYLSYLERKPKIDCSMVEHLQVLKRGSDE